MQATAPTANEPPAPTTQALVGVAAAAALALVVLGLPGPEALPPEASGWPPSSWWCSCSG